MFVVSERDLLRVSRLPAHPSSCLRWDLHGMPRAARTTTAIAARSRLPRLLHLSCGTGWSTLPSKLRRIDRPNKYLGREKATEIVSVYTPSPRTDSTGRLYRPPQCNHYA